jgi:uncharacterized delta-60 repeat protein
MQRSSRLARAVLAAAGVLASTSASAQTLDASFGAGGKVITSFGGVNEAARSVAVQPDRRIVLAGSRALNGNNDFALARYNPDGTLDAGFGAGGRAITDFGSPFDFASSIAVQADGRIIAAGYVNGDFGLARYNADGTLDRGFGANGTAATSFGGTTQGVASIALQGDGKIVAAGAANLDGTFGFALARYNIDGSLDATFGKNGTVTGGDFDLVGQGFSFALAYAVAVQPDGKIVAAGEAFVSGGFDFALARYESDGSLDESFGIAGRRTINLGGGTRNDRARAIVVQADGKIVAAGGALIATATAGSFNVALVRLNGDGTLDRSFGTNGTVNTDFAGFSDFAFALAVRPDGKIVAAGQSGLISAADVNFALVRYNSNGTHDATFGFLGRLIVDFALSPDIAAAVAMQPDGKAVAAGAASVAGISRFALARFQ